MNQQAADALVEAAIRGVRQIRRRLTDGEGGVCANGMVAMALTGKPKPFLSSTAELAGYRMTSDFGCDQCGLPTGSFNEGQLIAHLNDQHDWDFLKIAWTFGPTGDAA